MKKFEKLPKEVIRIRIDDKPYLEESFYNVCKWWLTTYPNSIFTEGHPIKKITDTIKEILEIK